MGKIGQISPAKFEKFLIYIGCSFSRQKGSHKAFRRSGLIRPIIVPVHSGDLPIFVIRNALKQLNLSVDEYLNILSRL